MADQKPHRLTLERIETYAAYLQEKERAKNTVLKYRRDLNALYRWLDGRELTKTALLEWKEQLLGVYAAASVNSMLAAVNGFLRLMGLEEMLLRSLNVQRNLFCDERRELEKEEYVRLVETAKEEGNERLSLLLQTLCATGIRVSELMFVTGKAVRAGYAKIHNKGKFRTVFLPARLCGLLKRYLQRERRLDGPVFVSRTGRPLDRSNIWRDMKNLCKNAGVEKGKVFPHNLRHLFARTHYEIEKDLSRLADLLGHANIGTTRIYTMESGRKHARQMERMGLVIT